MTADELLEHLAVTIADLSTKLREAVLAGNSGAAADWGSALSSACSGYDYLSSTIE